MNSLYQVTSAFVEETDTAYCSEISLCCSTAHYWSKTSLFFSCGFFFFWLFLSVWVLFVCFGLFLLMPPIERKTSELDSSLICLHRYNGALWWTSPSVRPELYLKPLSGWMGLGSGRHFCLYICCMTGCIFFYSWNSPFMPKSSGSFLTDFMF